jgi:Holliday junction resolvase RusA-like endonuclease
MVSKIKKIKFILQGQVPAKKNDLRRGRYGQFYHKEDKAMTALVLQLKVQKAQYTNLPLKDECTLNLSVWGGDRKDLNNECTTICDLLENAGIVENDRQIKHIIATKVVDNKNPRVIIELK